ncbi:MAG TPA: NAD(P)-dependent oxidoreductase [Xanthobacteraceae bacterium]
MPANSVIVLEDDPFLRLIGVLLDPNTSAERTAAFADFFAHDEPDFLGYCGEVRRRVGTLFPAEVRIVETQEEMRAALPGARALIVESLRVGSEETAVSSDLAVVQKFGVVLRNIDQQACAAKGVKVLTLRRRANCACAEMAFALMLIMAKRLNQLMGRISVEELAAAGYPYRQFDRRHTPNSNWARISGVRMLQGSTIGIVGLGEIGREIALRAAAFGMHTLYYQRQRLSAADESNVNAIYVPLPELMAQSDWILPVLPISPATRGLIGRDELAHVKPGAILVNVSTANAVDRAALLDALRSSRLGGFALDPLYEAPGSKDDELLSFPNVVLSPHLAGSPRLNALDDMAEMCEGIAKALGTSS